MLVNSLIKLTIRSLGTSYFGHWNFEYWDLFVFWCLYFVISNRCRALCQSKPYSFFKF